MRVTYDKLCEYCGSPYKSKKRDGKYCAVRCRTAACRLRQTIKELEGRGKRRCQ